MPTRPDAEILAYPLQAGVCIWVNHSSLGNAKSKKGSPDLPLNPNIVPCLLPIPKSFGFVSGLLADLGFPHTSATPLHADNTSSIRITKNPVFHEQTKHIEVDYHFIRNE